MKSLLFYLNNYAFALLQCTLLILAAGKLLQVKHDKKFISIYYVAFSLSLFVMMKLRVTPSPFLNLFLVMAFFIVLCKLIFSNTLGEIVFFTIILYYEMMLCDLFVGNIVVWLLQNNIINVIEINENNRFIYSTLSFLLFFCAVSITCIYFEAKRLQTHNKYWMAINTILMFCFTISLAFMEINSSVISQRASMMALLVWVGFATVSFLIIKFFINSCYYFQFEKSQLLARLKYEALEVQLKKQEHTIRDIKIMKHDMKHYIKSLCYMQQDTNQNNYDIYIEEIINKIDSTKSCIYCRNTIINGILNLKSEECSKKTILLKIRVESEFNTNLSPIDLTAILSNLLDNAIEGVEAFTDEEKTIQITIYKHKSYECYIVSNPFTSLDNDYNNFETTKSNKEEHGYGLYSVREIAQKYNGHVSISTKNNKFRITVMLYNQ